MQHLDIVDISARYGSHQVLRGISLGVDRGQITSLVGPSGSGKSTLLRVLVGLLPPDSGHVSFDGQRIDYSNKRNVKAIRDRFAIVFQQYNLFQNMVPKAELPSHPVVANTPEPDGHRDVWFDGKAHNAAIYDRAKLTAGAEISGPAIVEQIDSTTVIPPETSASVDTYLNILIRV